MTTNFTSCIETSRPSGPLSEEQIARFRENGFLAFEQILTDQEVREARAAISEVIDRHAFNEAISEFVSPAGGKGNHGGATFRSRTSAFFFQTEPGLTPSADRKDEVEIQVRKLMNFVGEHPAFQQIARGHSAIQPMLDSLLGPGSVLFQEMALIKPPGGVSKPWHQDNAYFRVTPLDSILGAWIALDAVNEENGCMHVIPGGHRLGAMKHHHTFDCEIVEGRLDSAQAVPIPLPAGGGMVFYGMLPHFTPINSSPERRRALQFHFHGRDARAVEPEDYNVVFAEADGTPASCAAARISG